MLTAKLAPTSVETIRRKWDLRLAPMYIKLCEDVGRFRAGEVHPLICKEYSTWIEFTVGREPVQPGRDFSVLLWVYRG